MLVILYFEKGMATHSSILAWRIPWTEEPGGLQVIVSQESDTTSNNWACMQSSILLKYSWFKNNNAVLISAVQQRDSIIYIFFFIFFSIMVYHRILSIGPCAIQYDLVYPSYILQ